MSILLPAPSFPYIRSLLLEMKNPLVVHNTSIHNIESRVVIQNFQTLIYHSSFITLPLAPIEMVTPQLALEGWWFEFGRAVG